MHKHIPHTHAELHSSLRSRKRLSHALLVPPFAGATALAECLAANSFIQQLDLSHNSIGPTGCKAVCEGIMRTRGCCAVSGLDLTANGVTGTVGRAALQRFIAESGAALVWLSVAENRSVAAAPGV